METSLEWHLTANHYPPLPRALIPLCVQAIEKANAGDWDAHFDPIPGLSNFLNSDLTVTTVVDELHLEAFIDYEEDY